MDEQQIAESILSAALTFDPTQNRPHNDADPIALLYMMMLGNRRWIYPRQLTSNARVQIEQGVRVLLHGERGSGKSTIVHSLKGALEEARPEAGGGSLFLLCDFNYETFSSYFDAARDPTVVVSEYISEVLDEGLTSTGIAQSTEDWLDLILLRRSLFFEDVKRALLRAGHPAAGLQPGDLSNLIERNTDIQDAWKLARSEYRSRRSERSHTIDRFRAAIRSGLTATLAVDNIDQLPTGYQNTVASFAHGLSDLEPTRLGVIVACRNNLVMDLVTKLDTGRTWHLSSMPYPEGEGNASWDVREILNLRIDFACSKAVIEALCDRFSFDRDTFASAMNVAATKVAVAISELWDPGSRTTAESRDELPNALVSWHNGNIRNVSQSIVALGSSPVDPTHLGAENQATRRRTRNKIYRHIVSNASAIGGAHPGGLHPSLSLFVAEPEDTNPHRPFFFLRYRLLAHLLHCERMRTVDSVVETFEHYGIAPQRVVEALNILAHREGYDSGFIRFDGASRLDYSSDDYLSTQVEILPAGSYVARELVSKCEYMYWSALELQQCREPVEEATGLSLEELQAVPPTDQIKVVVSASYLRSYLLPRFEKEHPYMIPDVSFDERDCRRIRRFQKDFGYQKNSWFIKRLRTSIESYALNAGVLVPSGSRSDLDAVAERETQLDRVLDHALR